VRRAPGAVRRALCAAGSRCSAAAEHWGMAAHGVTQLQNAACTLRARLRSLRTPLRA